MKPSLLERNGADVSMQRELPTIHLDDVVAQSAGLDTADPEREARIVGVVIGELVAFAPSGAPLVRFNGRSAHHPLPAKTTVALDNTAIGRDVALMFEHANPRRPLVIGIIQRASESNRPASQAPPSLAVQRDEERLVLTAEREIELRCGEASITLTRAGKVIIRGAYLVSRSSGANIIKGGAVHIN